MKRRDFIKTSALGGVALAAMSGKSLGANEKKLNLGFIGIGLRGTWHVKNALERSDCRVAAAPLRKRFKR